MDNLLKPKLVIRSFLCPECEKETLSFEIHLSQCTDLEPPEEYLWCNACEIEIDSLDDVIETLEPVDLVVLREQITTILIGHANDIGESDFADGKQHKKITNKAVDAVFSLITGETK